jgi:carbon-monoxide dehydrogenase catalytic subunit
VNIQAVQLADFFDQELKITTDESRMVEIFAPQKRKPIWKELNIYPAGVQHEVENSIASCLTNVDGDYVSLAKKSAASWVIHYLYSTNRS